MDIMWIFRAARCQLIRNIIEHIDDNLSSDFPQRDWNSNEIRSDDFGDGAYMLCIDCEKIYFN